MDKGDTKKRIVLIVGPTASGKSALAIDLALAVDGEIVNADSQQVYKRLNIGTAKPSEEERKLVPHHLIDIVEPWQHFDGAMFVKLADQAIAEIVKRGKVPIVVGGTGMYINFLLYGLSPSPPQDENLRKQLKKRAQTEGPQELYSELQRIDPEYAKKISSNDAHRIVRALEVYYLTGEPLSAQHKRHKKELRYNYLALMPKFDRNTLYERINKRFDEMLQKGLLDEVKQLLDDKRIAHSPAMQSLGYRHLIDYLQGKLTLEEAVRLAKRDSRRYAKRQITWFSHQLKGIQTVDYPPLTEDTVKQVRIFIKGV